MEEGGYDWEALFLAIEKVADTFPGCRAALAGELALAAVDMVDGHEGRLPLLQMAQQIRKTGPTQDVGRGRKGPPFYY